MIALPLVVSEESHAVLGIISDRPNTFSGDAVMILAGLAEDLAKGIEAIHARATQSSHKAHFDGSLEATLLAIATAVELRDPYTIGHQGRVAELAKAIAREMGFISRRSTGSASPVLSMTSAKLPSRERSSAAPDR